MSDYDYHLLRRRRDPATRCGLSLVTTPFSLRVAGRVAGATCQRCLDSAAAEPSCSLCGLDLSEHGMCDPCNEVSALEVEAMLVGLVCSKCGRTYRRESLRQMARQCACGGWARMP